MLYLPPLAWGGLELISGIILVADGFKMGEEKIPTLRKEVDLESQTKYPKELLARYVKQYPHNPMGVLEWHINKKIKEGKTREQAVNELLKESA